MSEKKKKENAVLSKGAVMRSAATKLWKHWGLLKGGKKIENWRCSNCGGGYKSCEDRGTSASFGCKRK
jgi:hypothetical protein